MLIEVRGTRLYVDRRGPEDAPPLLFLHGGPGSGSYDFMSFQGDRLAEQLHVVGVDQRGVQQSDPLTGPVTEHDLIADFEALRETLGLEQWSILGHSYGGRLAVRYAVMHPEVVTKVMFENPGWAMVLATDTLLRAAQPLLPGVEIPPHTGPATKQMWDERIALLGGLGDRRMEIYLGPDTKTLALPSETELPEEIQSRAARFSDEITRTADFAESPLPLFAKITQPALLVKGEHDPATSPEEIARFQSDVPHSTYYFASGAGHFVHAEQPELFTKLITNFVLAPVD
ncbi:alpha/beta hydrolase [Kribbella pittospori]|uniref:Alpha/beta hydrolase n=1 Tax=Kribbella pittospori TaxID=722689 RepID=A0A4R0KDR1_9ACTN|nr:alpha/beta hydrolase [Kribbella pittospori]TCC57989.1 alpha/beta hydrolase [Kribbella pittospori]